MKTETIVLNAVVEAKTVLNAAIRDAVKAGLVVAVEVDQIGINDPSPYLSIVVSRVLTP